MALFFLILLPLLVAPLSATMTPAVVLVLCRPCGLLSSAVVAPPCRPSGDLSCAVVALPCRPLGLSAVMAPLCPHP